MALSTSALKTQSDPARIEQQPPPRTPRSIVLRTNDALTLDEQQDWYLTGAYQNVTVVVWRRQANEEAVRRLTLAVEWMRTKYARGHSSVHVVIEGTQPATSEAQKAFVKLMGQSGVACAAAIYLGSGFWASSLRSNSTQMTMRVSRPFEFRQHRSIEEVGDWLPSKHFELTGVRLRPERLVSVVDAFRRESEPASDGA